MSIRAKTGSWRCATCRLHKPICLCDDLPDLQLKRTRLTLLLHHYEQYKTTNTGALAAACVRDSRTVLFGGRYREPSASVCDPDELVLLLYPDEAVPLESFEPPDDRPLRLVVPDGTWRQASKMIRRVPELQRAVRVSLPMGEATRYCVRFSPRPDSVSTMEAVARALGVLEGEQVAMCLESIFRQMMDRLLWVRGKIGREAVYGGLPEGVMRHLLKTEIDSN